MLMSRTVSQTWLCYILSRCDSQTQPGLAEYHCLVSCLHSARTAVPCLNTAKFDLTAVFTKVLAA